VKRVLFGIISGASLLMFIAILAVWIRSYWIRDIFSYVDQRRDAHLIQSIRGRLHILSDFVGTATRGAMFSHHEDLLSQYAIWNGGTSGYPVNVEWHLGHVWQRYSRFHMTRAASPGRAGFTTNHRLIVIPYWSPAVLSAILPTTWTWRFIKYGRRRQIGHCPKCNYDLRATPERCPECGWARAGL
jgi:hypothetical protein